MATRLNQIIAVEKGVKSDTHSRLTTLHHQVQKTTLLNGITRTYQKRFDDGPELPGESTRVQVRAEDILRDVASTMGRLFDVTATKDWANCEARADVIVDGQALLADVPVTYLLFLEKQLVDIETFVKKLPVLDPAESWHPDAASDAWATEPTETAKTTKVPRNHVLAEATAQHPAQVQVWQEDIVVGYWKTIKFSGALEAARVSELLARVEKLATAVKFAREHANGAEVQDQRVAAKVFGYLFA